MENEEPKEESAQPKLFYCVLKRQSSDDIGIVTVKTNLSDTNQKTLEETFTHRLEKGLLRAGCGSILSVDLEPEIGCYHYAVGSDEDPENYQYILCLLSENEITLDLFRVDLDRYCSSIAQDILTVSNENELPGTLVSSLENWHTGAVEYIVRCKQAVKDGLKYLIHAALFDKKLVLSGGTAELQSDIERFYNACSLSDILSQLRNTRQEDGSSRSLDMLLDLDSGQTDIQSTLTVSITVDSVRLDSNGCNKFCEEWANRMSNTEVQNNPVKLKQIAEAYKLKFIQTMNTLKRLLREAENDFYALYRSYVFLRDSGNSDVLLHYVTTEGSANTTNVLNVLQDFITEKHSM